MLIFCDTDHCMHWLCIDFVQSLGIQCRGIDTDTLLNQSSWRLPVASKQAENEKPIAYLLRLWLNYFSQGFFVCKKEEAKALSSSSGLLLALGSLKGIYLSLIKLQRRRLFLKGQASSIFRRLAFWSRLGTAGGNSEDWQLDQLPCINLLFLFSSFFL